MNFKKLFTIMVSIILMITSSISIFAHSMSQNGIIERYYLNNKHYSGYFIGGENIGWGIDERNHTNGTSITYRFDDTDMILLKSIKV